MRKDVLSASIATLMTSLAVSSPAPAAEALKYPSPRRVEHADTYHGTKVDDPYRWFEENARTNQEIAGWVKAENELTAHYLDDPALRNSIHSRLEKLWNFERYTPPQKVGPRYAYARNDGLQNQAVLYVIDGLEGKPRVLLDPNSWSTDGAVALAGTSFSPSGKLLTYGRSESGSDWQTWRVLDVAAGREFDDKVEWIKFSHMAWTNDEAGFYYAGYPEPKNDEAFSGLNLNQQVRYHRLGSKQADDEVVYRSPDHPEWSYDVEVTDDGRYLVMSIRKADDEHFKILYKDLTKKGDFVPLVDHFDNQFYFISNRMVLGGRSTPREKFYFLTDRQAPQRKLIEIDLEKPREADWKVIIPEGKETLRAVSLLGDQFLALSFVDAATRVRAYDVDGSKKRDVTLPGVGTAAGFTGRNTDTETFYSFANPTHPTTIYRYDVKSGQSTLFRQPKLGFNPDDYQVEQIFYKSKDGTRVPMTISYKKGLKRDGANPTLLYGYGGFGISLTPIFSVAALAWMERGGVYAVPNLRGGGEYGEAWHAAGAKLVKQNVFDDFIAAAQYLIDEHYTNSKKLAIQGASNGGLLVAACLIQRPELFGACLSDVPVTDMLRFHHYTDGRFWVTDYGSADDEKEFRALLAYSPYHNVKEGVKYPPTLVTTADTDDRVVPMHSFKFVAALQRAQAGDAPILLHVSTRAGHGAGKPTSQKIDEVTDQFLFLSKAVKLKQGNP